MAATDFTDNTTVVLSAWLDDVDQVVYEQHGVGKTTVASATTPDIFAATVGNFIDYTGTTTCTGFTAAVSAGSHRVLYCAGAAVFTAGANLLIDGVASGSNLTCVAGDILDVVANTTTQFKITRRTIFSIGTWTPAITFDTPGNVAVTYTTQTGYYTKIGRLVTATYIVQTSSFTHTTAAGTLFLTGLPYASSADKSGIGACYFRGITMAGYTQIAAYANSTDTKLAFMASGSGVANTVVGAVEVPTGGTVNLSGTISYFTTS